MEALRRPTCLPTGVSVWTGAEVEALCAEEREALSVCVDSLGAASADAQQLKQALTSVAKLRSPSQRGHRLYLLCLDERLAGLLRVGPKHLFYYSGGGEIVEMDILCVLDICVAPGLWRRGLGKLLFSEMLASENVPDAACLAYDRPSPKMMSFLCKHYGLKEFAEQPNRFVVFDRYFGQKEGEKEALLGSALGLHKEHRQVLLGAAEQRMVLQRSDRLDGLAGVSCVLHIGGDACPQFEEAVELQLRALSSGNE
eukprot:scaffold7352_cov254-Pinguiococcus_pyrenoidosus.AAC.3